MDQRISTTCRQAVELCEKFCREQNNQLILLAKQLGTLFAEGGHLLIAGTWFFAAGCTAIGQSILFQAWV